MSKKIISLILAICLVLLSVVPSFAANGDTVAPVSSTGNSYYYNGSTTSQTSAPINNWGQLVTWISYSIANSIKNLGSNFSTGTSNIVTAVNDVWTRLGVILSSVDQIEGYIDGIEGGLTTVYTYLGDIKGYTDQIETKIDTSNTSLSNIYSLLQNGGLVDEVKIKDNTSNGFSQAYFWKKWLTGSNVQLNTIDSNGDLKTTNRFDFGTNSILGGLEAILYYYGNGLVTSASRITQHVVDSSYATDDYLYDTDLVGTNMSKDSLWSNVRDIGSNLSLHLSRLSFVLASDEEIEARQAAADTQDSVVDNFIKPSGSGSASASDFADVASAGSSVKNALDSNVSAGNAFTSLSSDSPAWGWFSQSTADSLDSTSSRNRKSAYSDTPYLDRYYSDLMETLKLK